MSQLTDAGAALIYRYLLEGYEEPSITPGTWFALFTAGPTHDLSGTTELGSYSRVQMPTWTYAGTWPALSATLNGAYVIDPMPSCTITGWGLFSDDTAGTLMYFELLDSPTSFTSGDRYVIPTGSIIIDLNT